MCVQMYTLHVILGRSWAPCSSFATPSPPPGPRTGGPERHADTVRAGTGEDMRPPRGWNVAGNWASVAAYFSESFLFKQDGYIL